MHQVIQRNLNKWKVYFPFTFSIFISLVCAAFLLLLQTIFLDEDPRVLGFPVYKKELYNQAFSFLRLVLIFAAFLFIKSYFNFIPKPVDIRLPKYTPRFLGGAVAVLFLVLMVFLFLSQPARFLNRDSYLSVQEHLGRVSVVYILTKSALGVSGLICGICYGISRCRSMRLLVSGVFIFSLLMLFSGGGKSIAFQLFLFTIPVSILQTDKSESPRRWASAFKIVGSILWFVIFYQLAVSNRASESHGIIPYLRNLTDPDFYVRVFDFSYLQGLLMFGAVVQVASEDYLSQGTVPLLVAINPLSGQMAGWNELSQDLRLAYFIPTPGLSELNAMTLLSRILFLVWILGCCSIVDYVVCLLGRSPLYVKGTVVSFLYCISIGWIQLFGVYNLRSSCRLIYYAIALSVMFLVVSEVVSILLYPGRGKRMGKQR